MTLDEKRDVILSVMNKPDNKITLEEVVECLRLVVGIMWPVPDAVPAETSVVDKMVSENGKADK